MRSAVLALALFGLVAVSAIDSGRKLFADKSLDMRSKAAAGVRAKIEHYRRLAKSGVLSTATAYGLLDQTITRGGFEGYEHSTGSGYTLSAGSGDAIKFKFIHPTSFAVVEQTTADQVLLSEDSVPFSYSEMTGVAGDYWSVKDSPNNIICNGPNRQPTSQGTRFTTAFNDMWENPKYGKAATRAGKKNIMRTLEDQLRAMLTKEKAGVDAVAATTAKRGSKYYENAPGFGILSMAGDFAKVQGFDTRVDGLATADGNVRALAHNDDHFFTCAQDTYRFGHTKAVKDAWAAGVAFKAATLPTTKAAAQRALTKAYAEDGFVSHFLSDQFSSGHLRTPRVELRGVCKATLESAPSAGLTANVMHDEDNWNCLLVTNALPGSPKWWACGDHKFFDQENGMNRRMLRNAIAASVKQVSDAFETGYAGGADPTAAATFVAVGLSHIPTVVGLTAREALENTCPLFYLSSGVLYARQDSDYTNGLPRPPAAQRTNYGSSLRWHMTPDLFPVFKTLESTTQRLAGAAPADPAQRSCSYKRADDSDCCTPAGRSVPNASKDPSGTADVSTGADGSTRNPFEKSLRTTYINCCKLAQSLSYGKKAVVAAGIEAGKTIIATNPVLNAASILGKAAYNYYNGK